MKSVTDEQANDAIMSEEYLTVGKKTTVCVITLKDGFEVVGSSACVFAENYDIEVGKPFARERAMALVWSHLGSILQNEMAVNKCCKDEKASNEPQEIEPISA